MNRVATIFAGQSVAVERFDHGKACFHKDDETEVTQSIAVTFVERGSFEIVDWNL